MLRPSILPPALAALLLGAGLLVAAPRVAAQGSQNAAAQVQPPVIEKARGGPCVEEPTLMRRIHMDLLRHQRDATVHGGIRGARHSLKQCIACHASTTTGSVAAAPTDFCVSCHNYAAVRIDCFECHASKP